MYFNCLPIFSSQKQCQIAVLPLGTGNDLARVLGWGSSCDDNAHLPQLLERYEKSTTKMLDRWSVMVFERAFVRNPKLSVSYTIDPILTSYEATLDLHIQSLIEANDLHIIVSSTKVICETVNSILTRLADNCREDVQLTIKCDILRQKLDMLLDTLVEEISGVHDDDDLLKSLNSIIKKSLAERYGTIDFKANTTCSSSSSSSKTEKDKLNSKEKFQGRLTKRGDKEALQCRSNSFKRAVRNIVEYPEKEKPMKPSRRMSLRMDSLRVQQANVSSSDTSPCSSPYPIPPINLISPSLSTTRLTCLSPLPDMRRDSIDESFLSTLNLPVPKQFADNGSRRSSGVPESIKETEESNSNIDMHHHYPHVFEREKLEITKISEEYNEKTGDYLGFYQQRIMDNRRDSYADDGDCGDSGGDGLMGYIPLEVYERNLLRSTKLQMERENSEKSFKLDDVKNENDVDAGHGDSDIDGDGKCVVAKSQSTENIYVGESMTIIDTDMLPDRSSSEEMPGEASDILSAISNEECSVTSEILDLRPHEHFTHAADIIQVSYKKILKTLIM